jgi:hypothetical protein
MFVQYNAFYMDEFTITVTNVTPTGSPGKLYGNCIPVLVKGFKRELVMGEGGHIMTGMHQFWDLRCLICDVKTSIYA